LTFIIFCIMNMSKWVTIFENIEKMNKNRVRQFREAIPLSIAELSRRAGLAPQTITKMEKGLPTRKNSELKVAKALQKKYEEVFISDTDI
jgi:DNA-binding XRE family transcriptional regulator